MNVNAKDIVDSIDLNRSEALLPIYESVVNSIISLNKDDNGNKKIEVIIEREKQQEQTLGNDFDNNIRPIETVTIVDNGEGFTDENFESFSKPFSKINRKYGCKGIGRFTILAMYTDIEVISFYKKGNDIYKRQFTFDATNEITDQLNEKAKNGKQLQTKVTLHKCYNSQLKKATCKSIEDIAKGIMEHCFIYYLSDALPQINVTENIAGNWESISVKSFFNVTAKEREKTIKVGDYDFKLYVIKSNQVTTRKYNYVAFCANSRVVGNKRDLSKTDSLYAYPISEEGLSKYLDVYVVSPFLDEHVNNQRTGFKIPESHEDTLTFFTNDTIYEIITMEDILKAVANELSSMYEGYAKETKKRSVEQTKQYIKEKAPQYTSFLYRKDVLDSMPPNLTDEKKEEYLHGVAYKENRKIDEKIERFVELKQVNEDSIKEIIDSIKKRTAYNSDALADYVLRRKAILRLFKKMLDQKGNGKYEPESMIHNLIFPMGLTNLQLQYQYHNLWLLDDRFSTFRFIGSDKAITSFSQIQSSHEPDLIFIDNEKNLMSNPISYGNRDSGEVDMMVIFEFKRPGDTAHQKNKGDNRWEFSVLVEKYFDDFLFGKEKDKKNYRGHIVKITDDTPKFGYVVMDEMPDSLIAYNKSKGWKLTPYHSYYKLNPEENLHIEAITYQNLLRNAEARNNPFFDNLFGSNQA